MKALFPIIRDKIVRLLGVEDSRVLDTRLFDDMSFFVDTIGPIARRSINLSTSFWAIFLRPESLVLRPKIL